MTNQQHASGSLNSFGSTPGGSGKKPRQPSTILEEGTPQAMCVVTSPGHHSQLQQPPWPNNLDMQSALASCEDASLSWSLQFWVTLADPVNQSVFFANPATGQCSWEPPVGAYVVPRSPEGEWWELADSGRGNRSYYFHTISGKTQWTRPEGDVMVIPLGLIQNNALPVHSPPSTPRSQVQATYSRVKVNGQSPSPTRKSTSRATPSLTSRKSPLVYAPVLALGIPLSAATGSEAVSPATPYGPEKSASRPLQSAEESAPQTTSESLSVSPGWLERMGLSSPTKLRGRVRSFASQRSISRPNLLEPTTPSDGEITPNVVDGLGRSQDALGRLQEPSEPIKVAIPVKTKRFSTGLHPILPIDISTQIQSFQVDDFAERYFATKRSGIFRKKVPVQRVMEWQRGPLTAPLLVLNRALWKDALIAFKVIQHVMADRERQVVEAQPLPSSLSARHLSDFAASASGLDQSNSAAPAATRSPIGRQWEEARWLIQLGAGTGEIRDELYCQLLKQLSKNPNPESVFLGFQLLCVMVVSFGPSKNFEPYVRAFLKSGRLMEDGIDVMAKYCLGKLEVMAARGGKGRALTRGEIEHAADAAFNPSIYGECLPTIMRHQGRSYPDLKIPIVLPFLAHGILALGGRTTEGTFRVSGDGEVVAELKSRMDKGHYQLFGVDDPHALASLFKMFLRDLESPLIPSDMYNEALEASRDPDLAIGFVKRLPAFNRRVLLFVISFIQLFITPDTVEKTKMTSQNLALVLAPNILRTTSDSLVTVINNASFEAKLIHQLLLHADTQNIDSDYTPVHAFGEDMLQG